MLKITMTKTFFYRLAVAIYLCSLPMLSFGQCPVTAYANPMSMQCGDTIILTAVADGCKPLDKDFNDGNLGTTWQATNGAVVNDGIGAYSCVGPAPEGTHSLWMGATVTAPRDVTTQAYDLTQCAATGGSICFWLKFSTQAGPDPCEGIDLPAEGVFLQYKTAAGTWTTLRYFDPNGGYDPVMTSWTYYCFALPAVAMTNATQFRWIQNQASGAGFDTWGLDHMVITLTSPGYTFDWAHDAQGPDPLPYTPPVVGINDTSFIVTYTNGIATCIDTVSVTVAQPTATAYASPISICATDQSQLDVTASLIPPLPQSCGISLTGCQGVTAQIPIGNGTVTETSYMPLGKINLTPNFSSCGTVAGIENSNHNKTGRIQMIIEKSEFPAFFEGGQLYGLTLFPNSSSGSYAKVSIKMGCTSKAQFASNTDWIAGLSTVYTPKQVNMAPGTAVFMDFDNHYDWPGGTNIVIEVCWTGALAREGNLFKTNTTGFKTLFAHTCTENGCGTTNEQTRFQFRPSMNLGICYRPKPVLSFDWTPVSPLDDATIKTPLATLLNTTNFTVTVIDSARPMCVVSSDIQVNVVQPTVDITPTSGYICTPAGTVILTSNALPSQPGGSITTYSWTPTAGLSTSNTANTTASPAATTTYTLTVTDNTGCSASDTVTIYVGTPPGPTAINGSRCGTGSVSLAVSGCTGIVNWYTASTGGAPVFTGNPFSTPSISSTTNYYATCTTTGCESARTTVIASVNGAPDANFSYAPNSACKSAGGTATPTITGTAGTFSAGTGLVINSSTGVINIATSTVGNYTVSNTIPASAGCPATTATRPFTISAPLKADFQYIGSPFCKNQANPNPSYLNGGQAGTFSASPPGLTFISPSTGQIDLAASLAGTYTVTNNVPASNGCAAATATFNVTINPAQDGSFTYPSASYCTSGTNPTPTVTGTSGGTFSASPTGIAFVSVSSGTINLASSTAGNYVVSYTTAGPCPDTKTYNLTISSPPSASFNYGNAPYCQTGANANPTFTNGGIAGTFTASPAGLVFVSNSTGVVNVGASTPGTYTVTNTVNSAGCAQVTATANITITTPKTADFSYPQASYCQEDADPSALMNAGASAGTFSASPAGLVFNNTSTGNIDLSASAANSYTITNTVATSNGCPAITATFSLTIQPTQDAGFTYSSGTYCQTGTDPTPTITGGSGGTYNSTPAGLIFSNPANGTIDLGGSTLGNYTVTYSLPTPCPANQSITVSIVSSPASTFSYAGPYCLNAVTNPSPTFAPGSTAGTFTSTTGIVFVNANTGQINLAASSAGTYTVTNTIPASGGCAVSTSTASVTLSATDDASFNYSATEYCANGTNPIPVISGTTGGTFSSSTGAIFISPATGEVNLSASPAGNHTISYSTSGACPDSKSVQINITSPLVPDFNFTGSPYCQGDPNPSPVFINGGTAGTFTEATGNLIFTNPFTGVLDLAASAAGTYTVRNTHPANNGCAAIFYEFIITISSTPAASFSYLGQPYCINGANPTVTLSNGATAGTFTSSSPNLVLQSAATGEVDLGSSQIGSYTVTNTVDAANGCPSVAADASITINGNDEAGFSYPGSPYCQTAGSATIALDPGAISGTFSSDPAVVINSATGEVDLTSSTPGLYWVYNTLTASNGCPAVVDSTQIQISAPNDATFDFGPAYCSNETDPLPAFGPGARAGVFSAAPAGLTFISDTTGQIDLSASSAGTYTITNDISVNGGCPASTAADMVTINQGQDAGFSYSQNTYCQAGTDPTPTITGTPGGIFTFNPNGISINTSTGTIDLDQSVINTYAITYSTQGSCADDSTVSITITDVPQADFQYNPNTYCVTGTDPFPVYINGGSAGTFTAVPAGLVFINNTTGQVDLSASAPNNYNVTNTIPSNGSCPGDVYTSLIRIQNVPNAEFTFSQAAYCQNEPNPSPIHTTGTAGTFSSMPAGVVFANNTGRIDLAASTPGSYVIRNLVSGAGSCPDDMVEVNVDINPMPTVNPSSNSPICEGDDLEFNVTTSPNSPGTTFAWSGPASFNSTQQNPTINSASPSASGDYTIQITSNGCTSFAILSGILVNPSSATTFDPAGPFCENENSSNLVASDNGGTWSGQGITITNTGNFDPAAAGIGVHTIKYINTTNCVYDSLEIEVKAVPIPGIIGDPLSGCAPLLSTLSASGAELGDLYSWNFGNGETSTNGPIIQQLFSNGGCYDISLTLTREGCSATVMEPQFVCALQNAQASFSFTPFEASPSLPIFDFLNNSSFANSYVWNFGDNTSSTDVSPSHSYPGFARNYTVTLIANNNNNCPDTIQQRVSIIEELIYYIPNTFTPDGDKFNQYFSPVFTSGFDPKQYTMQIFNRWGELIFQSSDTEIGWDGTYKNRLCEQGVYTWKIYFKRSDNDQKISKTGTVNLLK
jgi:gliding motility-associated-like protein